MPITDHLANQIANATLRNQSYSSPANVYISLYTTAPTVTTSGTEVSGNGYSRQLATFGAPSSGNTSTTGNITFTCTGNTWGSVVAFAVVDSSTGGNIMWFNTIQSRRVIPDDSVILDSGNLTISIG